MPTNGTTNGVHHATDTAFDVEVDSLYSWWPAPAPAPAPCPEALFSLTLKGKLDGIETLLTVRGMTASEFQQNLQVVRGLLDRPVQAASPTASQTSDPTPQCPQHGALKPSIKGTGWYCPVKLEDDTWCKGRS